MNKVSREIILFLGYILIVFGFVLLIIDNFGYLGILIGLLLIGIGVLIILFLERVRE